MQPAIKMNGFEIGDQVYAKLGDIVGRGNGHIVGEGAGGIPVCFSAAHQDRMNRTKSGNSNSEVPGEGPIWFHIRKWNEFFPVGGRNFFQ